MLLIYALIAIFIAWIWVDYYRIIDLYEHEELKYFLLTFFLGALSVNVVIGLEDFVYSKIHIDTGSSLLNDILENLFRVALTEEIAKLIPFLIMLKFFRSHVNEPIDYLAYISVSALGFAAAENTLYFSGNGSHIINARSILSTVGHMFNSSLVAYGIILYSYHPKKYSVFIIPLFLMLGSIAHGFYNFWLLHHGGGFWFITIIYFFVSINWFAVILNNALNNSGFFTYKKVINPNKVAGRLLLYYAIIFLVQFSLLTIEQNVYFALLNLTTSMYMEGLIIMITCLRLSRFKLIKNRWEGLKFQLPFKWGIREEEVNLPSSGGLSISIRGESYNETHVNEFYREYLFLSPVSLRNSILKRPHIAFIEQKIFLKNLETYYVAKLYEDMEYGKHRRVLLKPKTFGNTMVNEKYPIVAMLKIEDVEQLQNPNASMKDFQFKEWAFIKPAPEIWKEARVSDDNLPEPGEILP